MNISLQVDGNFVPLWVYPSCPELVPGSINFLVEFFKHVGQQNINELWVRLHLTCSSRKTLKLFLAQVSFQPNVFKLHYSLLHLTKKCFNALLVLINHQNF